MPAMFFVIDGGALLHHVKWLRNVPLLDIASQYTGLVWHRYETNCIVVFDGYDAGASTKYHERLELSGPSAAYITFFSKIRQK